MFKWLRGKMKNGVTGTVDTSKKLVGYENSRAFAADTITIAKQLLNPQHSISRARTETFAEAQARLKVTDEDLVRNLRNFAWISLISLAFALFLAAIVVGSIVFGNFFQTFVGFSIMLLCLANAFKYSFRAFQIKHKNLCGVDLWLKSKCEWIPNPLVK
jgi:intracellular multiplication protein IcmV